MTTRASSGSQPLGYTASERKPAPGSLPPPTGRDRWLWALLLVTCGLYLFRLGVVGLYEPAEGRYADISRAMLSSGDWVIPRLNSLRYLEKPPVLYWMTAASFHRFGLNECAARLPTMLAALAGIAATVALGATLGGRAVGVRAGIILATSLGYFVFARIVRPDMWLIASLTAGLFFLVRGFLEQSHPRWWSIGLGAALGIAVLAKGAIGLVIPIGALLVFRLFSRSWGGLRRFSPVWGIGVFLGLVLPWHLWMAIRDPHFFWFYVVNEHLLRFINHRVHSDAVPLPILLFWLVSGVWAFPWSTFLPVAWVERQLWVSWRHAGHVGRAYNLLGLWALVVLGLFTVNASRAEYYALPALPAMAVLMGRLWTEIDARRVVLVAPSRWLPAVVYGMMGVVGILVFRNIIMPGRVEAVAWGGMIQRVFLSVPFSTALGIPTRDLNEAGVWNALRITLGVLLASGALAAVSMRLRGNCMRTLAISMFPLLALTQQGFQLFEPVWSSKTFSRQLASTLPPGTPIVIDGPFENANSVGFYLKRATPFVIYKGATGDLVFGSSYPEARSIFLNKKQDLVQWASTHQPFCLITEDEEGWAKFQEILPTMTAAPLAKSGRKVAFGVSLQSSKMKPW